MQAYNLVSLAGIPILLALAWLCSTNRRKLNWRLILWGLGLQMTFAVFIFVVPAGTSLFMTVNHLVIRLLDTAAAGVRFVFGTLALSPGEAAEAGAPGLGFILAFQGLPTIIFFSALVAVLYHFRIMPLIIRGFAWVFTKTMRISGAESLAAASNIFVGVESAITVRPFLAQMTRSELCTVLTAGMATVASNVLVLYVNFLRDIFPAIAGHLVSASILSAPAAVIMAKILLPEDGQPETLGLHVRPHCERARSWFEAIINGA
ncbi:MAG: nucleoside transporter, partial [Acidobacteria bacterium]|nr:nucleoside transporter [Acidobacteriota bacterium]